MVELGVGGVNDRGTIVRLNAYWHDVKMDYDGSGNLLYRGVNHVHNVATSSTDWEIWKYTYSDAITRIEGPLPGAWDDRATLAWG